MWSGNYVLRGKYTRFTLSSGPALYCKSLNSSICWFCLCYKHNAKHHIRESFASWSSIWHCLSFLKLKKHFYILQLATRPFDVMGTAVSQSYAVCQRMLHYVQSFEHYMTFEVFFLSVLFSTSIPSSVFIWFIFEVYAARVTHVIGVLELSFQSDTCYCSCLTWLLWRALSFYGSSGLHFSNRKLLTLDAYLQVLEPNWHSMHSSLVVSKSIDEVRCLT